MGLYGDVLFPRVCDFCLGNPHVARHRQELLADVDGDLLEIGFGTGLNLPHYPKSVRRLTTVDPSAGMHRLAEARVKQTGIAVDHHALKSERLPFEDGRFDGVICTFTLCSIEDVDQAVGEVHRVLRPGGRLHFLEHGLAPNPKTQKWQRRLNWLQVALAGGCHLDRDVRGILARKPFIIDCQQFYLEKAPATHGYLYKGHAAKPRAGIF